MDASVAPACLPVHGRVPCSVCHPSPAVFDVTRTEGDGWRITANPLAWGNRQPEVLVLGFSKGPSQAGALVRLPHDEIAYRRGRANAYKILAHLGLVPSSAEPASAMRRLIADRSGRFGFGSFVRCTVERWDSKEAAWMGTGGGMLDRFVATPFGAAVAARCADTFLNRLPAETRLVVMYGLGSRGGYVNATEQLIRRVRGRCDWQRHDAVSYGDASVTFVHTEHFAAQGVFVPNWLGALDGVGNPKDPERTWLGQLAAAAVRRALARTV